MNTLSAHDKDPSIEYFGEPGRYISGIGMLTADRPALLQRGLSSYIANAARHLRQVEYVVYDDSKDVANRCASLELARALALKFDVKIRFAGIEERERFVRHLEEFTRISKQVLKNALLQPQEYTVGQNRNALLLDSVGTLFLCVDDDTVCTLAAPPTPAEGLQFGAGKDPAGFWCFRDFAEVRAAATWVDEDFLGAHQALLGRTAEEVHRSLQGAHTDGRQLRLPAARSADSIVRVTLNGLVGDCAWGAPFGFWHVPMGFLAFYGASLERLISSEEHYRQTLRSRLVLRVTATPVLSDASFCMLGMWGLDNRELLPPNVPQNRGQDLVFGQLLWKCFHQAVIGHLPLAVLHDPIPPRRFWDGEIFRSAAGVDLCRIIIEAVRHCELSDVYTSPQVRLKVVGEHLIHLADLPQKVLSEYFSERLHHSNRQFELEMIERASQTQGQKHFYASDVFRYCQKIKAAEGKPDYWVPLDLRLRGTSWDSGERTSAALRQFGELLVEWPEIVAGARQLRENGIRLSLPV